jgi:hypothetical protein
MSFGKPDVVVARAGNGDKQLGDRNGIKRKELQLRGLVSSGPLPCVVEQDETIYAVSTADSAPSNSEADTSNRSTVSSRGHTKELVTTMMICSLPYDVTSDQLITAINVAGFGGLYDFVYLPARSIKKWKNKGSAANANARNGNVGYAFVNFRDPEDASRFQAIFTGSSIPGVTSDKEVLVTQAVCQGYASNLAMHYGKKKNQGSLLTFSMDQDQIFGA